MSPQPRNEGSNASEVTSLVSEVKIHVENDERRESWWNIPSYTSYSSSSLGGRRGTNYLQRQRNSCVKFFMILLIVLCLGVLLSHHIHVSINGKSPFDVNVNVTIEHNTSNMYNFYVEEPIGSYKLVENQEGMKFFDYYHFYDGEDSLGSAGYNTYVSYEEAKSLGIVGVMNDLDTKEEFIFMKSSPTTKGPRSSIRLEGKRRFDRGLFILDLRHMPNGPGVWPAFWLTDEDNWPDNGEIDIVEGINNQTVAKTALHTSKDCDMFAHVSDFSRTGSWEWSTGLPNTYTGIPDYKTVKEADNCWEWAPHQWYNQGCVGVSSEDGTLGKPLNEKGGGIYALEWDPKAGHIRSYVFTPHQTAPTNLIDAINTAHKDEEKDRVQPDSDLWGLPYAYFAIGDKTGCSADHFKNMRVVFNLAFCGTVAGNRFFGDCPLEANKFNVSNDPIASCDAYIQADPEELSEAFWKIKGLYIYERDMVVHQKMNFTN